MDCRSHAVTRRRWMWGSVMASVGAMLGGGAGRRAGAAAAEPSEAAPAALAVLRKSISVDVHTHGGTTGITSMAPPSDDLANAMRAGSLATACLADVPDGPILGRNAAGVDRKSTRLNSSHEWISYAVFCLKKKRTKVNCLFLKKKKNIQE